MNLNKIFIGGRLTTDPELRQTPGGTSVVRISVAVSRGKPRDGGEEITDFIDVTAFDKRAELIVRNFRKGSNILVVGRLQQRRWENKNGEKRQSYEVSADEIQFVDPRDTSSFSNVDGSEQSPFSPAYGAAQYAPVTVPSTGKQVGIPIPPSYLPPSYGGSQAGFEEIPGDDQVPF